MEHQKKSERLHYAWVIFAVCTFVAFTLIGLCHNTRSLYLEPVSSGLGVSRSEYAVTLLIGNLISAGISLLLGRIRTRVSLRTLMLAGLSSAAVGNVIFVLTDSFGVFLIGEVLMGVAMGCSAMTVISLIIRNWFADHHGTILGALYMATGLGSVVFAPVVGPLIEQGGYRRGYGFHMIVMLSALLLAALTLKDEPAQKHMRPLSLHKAGERAQTAEQPLYGMMLRDACRTVRFWLMLLLGVMIGFGVQVVQGTYAAHIGSDLAYGTTFAAGIVSTLYVVNTCAKIPIGMMLDKIGIRSVLLVCSAAMGASALMLVLLKPGAPAAAYAFAVCLGIGNIIFTVPCPLVALHTFGSRDATTLTGIFMASTSLGAAIGSPVSNAVYESCGTYAPIYLGMLAMFAAAAVLSLTVVRPAYDTQSKAGH